MTFWLCCSFHLSLLKKFRPNNNHQMFSRFHFFAFLPPFESLNAMFFKEICFVAPPHFGRKFFSPLHFLSHFSLSLATMTSFWNLFSLLFKTARKKILAQKKLPTWMSFRGYLWVAKTHFCVLPVWKATVAVFILKIAILKEKLVVWFTYPVFILSFSSLQWLLLLLFSSHL